MKVVFDSSVLFSAFLKSSTSSKRLLGLVRTSELQICLSEQILQETAAALFSKAGQFNYTEGEVLEYVALLAAVATVVDDLPAIDPVCRDPDDDHVLAAAVGAGAAAVVTGDSDLLVLGRYGSIRIMTVRELLDVLAP